MPGDISSTSGGSTEPHVLSYPGRRDNQLFISGRDWPDLIIS
jgi:hypothetical protein